MIMNCFDDTGALIVRMSEHISKIRAGHVTVFAQDDSKGNDYDIPHLR